MSRTFDWKPRFDEKSREYPIRGLMRVTPKRKTKLWVVGPILDQGQEGACVGFGWTAKILSEPFWFNLKKLPKGIPTEPQPFAFDTYNQAKKIDEYPGEDYEGTSVLAGAKVMQNYGIVKSYSWAFSIDEMIDGLIKKGPVVLGINWYDGMYDAPNGVLSVSGKIVGGHCITAVGFRVASPTFGGEDSIILQNSWGPDWGLNGLAEIRVSDMAKLLADSGEACLPLQSAYRRAKPSIFDFIKKFFAK